MIPDSLKIALFIGVSAGAVTALVLADVRDNDDIRHVAGPSLTVLSDKSDYKRGETVNVTIVNSGSVPLFFPDGSYGLEVTGLAGMTILSPAAAQDAGAVLDPGRERHVSWDQRNNDGEQVFDGIYRISVHGFDDAGTKIQQSRTVNVIEIDLTFGS